MAIQESLVCISRALSSTADFSTRQFRFVTLQTDGDAIVNGTAGGWCLGVSQSAPSTASSAAALSIAIAGVSKIWLASSTGSTASVVIGNPLQSDANGRAIAATTADIVLGYSLTAHSSAAAAAIGEMVVTYAGIY